MVEQGQDTAASGGDHWSASVREPAALLQAADESRYRPALGRAIAWIIAGILAVAAAGFAIQFGQLAGGLAAAAACCAAGLVGAVLGCLPAAALRVALTLTGLAALLALTAVSVLMGWGLAAPTWPLLGPMIIALCIAAGWQAGSVMALCSAAAVSAVGLGAGPPSAVAGAAEPPVALQLGWSLLLIAGSLTMGVLLSQRLWRSRRSVAVRVDRFRRLLALAVDGYWETNQHYQLVAAADDQGEAQPWLEAARGLQTPWELPQWSCEPETLDGLMADLDNRQPFRDVPVCWQCADGSRRHFRASGEPRFDRRGIFTGYWGVVRDITEQVLAQAALAATETRYRELFSRIPTPLVLHRGGVIFDANAAALALFGQPSLDQLYGTDLLACYESGDSRERARRRLDLLQGQPLGTTLPVTDFKLALPDRRVAVRATSVRVDAEGGPASLAIFVDDTERLAAEEAVRRSEAMLSHLVATSPDLITLTEVSSGRYAMVNRSFERIIGWSAAEAVGHTASELAVWDTDAARLAFERLVGEQGAVANQPVTFRKRSGKPVSMVVSAAVFAMDRHDYMVINARDVTDQERARLEREAILLNASIGIAVTRKREVVLANRHFEQLFGWAPGEGAGKGSAALWDAALDYAETGSSASAALARGEPVEMERQLRRKDGSAFTARIRGRSVDPARPLEGGAIWIVEDVTERREFEQALARARDEAEAANRAKSVFLANTSHELRTPLNALIGLAQLARDDAVDVQRRRRFLVQIEQSAKSLAAIISDILDLSRIEAGKLPIEARAFDLAAELRSVYAACQVLADSRGLELRLDLSASIQGQAMGDALRVRQIANNFLVNAIKFTEAGTVWLRATRLIATDQDLVRIEVQDTGPGISAEVLARLFKPFTQADDSTTRRFGGTGLGLSICHDLAGLMGGRVGGDSREGQGSTFWAELPLPEHQPPPAAALISRPAARSLPGARVLMAEDNAVNMMIAVAMLELWGVDAVQAIDGRQAVAAVQQAAAAGRPFDAVLMDVQMPVMSGHASTRALRELETAGGLGPAGGRLPVIALTAAALVTEREQALAAGMDDFLTKPIDADKLHAALVRWCHRFKAIAH
jgi:PAS domain S-box-containing protein